MEKQCMEKQCMETMHGNNLYGNNVWKQCMETICMEAMYGKRKRKKLLTRTRGFTFFQRCVDFLGHGRSHKDRKDTDCTVNDTAAHHVQFIDACTEIISEKNQYTMHIHHIHIHHIHSYAYQTIHWQEKRCVFPLFQIQRLATPIVFFWNHG